MRALVVGMALAILPAPASAAPWQADPRPAWVVEAARAAGVPVLFALAVGLTETEGSPNPDAQPGDDGRSWGRFQVSIARARDFLGTTPSDAEVVTKLLQRPHQLAWAMATMRACLALFPPGHWSRAYRCYNAGPGASWAPRNPNVLRFAKVFRRLVRNQGGLSCSSRAC